MNINHRSFIYHVTFIFVVVIVWGIIFYILSGSFYFVPKIEKIVFLSFSGTALLSGLGAAFLSYIFATKLFGPAFNKRKY